MSEGGLVTRLQECWSLITIICIFSLSLVNISKGAIYSTVLFYQSWFQLSVWQFLSSFSLAVPTMTFVQATVSASDQRLQLIRSTIRRILLTPAARLVLPVLVGNHNITRNTPNKKLLAVVRVAAQPR